MGSYAHNTGTFIGKGGTEIFFQNWCVDKPKGILVIAHGVGEHSGRYGAIINELQGGRISVYALDHRGHGRSGGKRGHVDSFMDYVNDLKLFINIIQEENENVSIILLGHSMGGVIACKYALFYSDDISGLVLSSPAFIPSVEIPAWKKRLGAFFSHYLPRISMPTGLDPKQLSHDRDVVEAYENDHLVHDLVSAKWYTEFFKSCEECLNRARELRLPLFVFHGKEDTIIDRRGSEKIHKDASSLNKKLYLFDGLYHETMNEIDNKDVLQTVARWIIKLFNAKKTAKHAKKKARNKPIKKIVKKISYKGSPKKGR
ncbi:MAG: hypothetical protein A2W19_00670 [Spirochaetes bacterium RBG_16_49_21]|nr:MAG: hypothetical protein A2W19_00670 [Spirochaetes bacterium RBG_16_49_21]